MVLPNKIPQTKAVTSAAGSGMVQKEEAELCSMENWVSAEMLLICRNNKAGQSIEIRFIYHEFFRSCFLIASILRKMFIKTVLCPGTQVVEGTFSTCYVNNGSTYVDFAGLCPTESGTLIILV